MKPVRGPRDRGCAPAVIVILAAMAGEPGWTARSMSWTPSPRELARGEAQGVAISSRGVLFPAPDLVRIGGDRLTGEPRQVWSAAVDGAGNVFLGTGPDGRILRLTPTGGETLYATVPEPMVTALAWMPGVGLLAGAAPGGRIYRISGEGDAELWSETGERYVWDLAVGADRSVWAGTGERGAVLRISSSGDSATFYDGEEAHIVSLSVDADGRVLAAGAGQGLLVRLDASGRPTVLLDSGLPEVVGMDREADGSVVVALVGEPPQESRPPALRIRLPDGTQVGVADEGLAVGEDGTRPEIRGYIEGLPSPTAGAPRRQRGKIVRVRPDGRFTELWSSDEETPFCVLADVAGSVLFGTGEPARLYRIDPSGDVALLATMREGQAARLIQAGARSFVATSNPVALYRVDSQRPEAAEFVSRPFDAGAPARWGALRWLAGRPSGTVELSTRSGNSSEPDGSWSAWAPAATDAETSRVRSPAGRYLQWKVRFSGARQETQVRDLTVHFEPMNRAPSLREFRLDSAEPAVSESATFRWDQFDPDGDPVRVVLEYRRVGGEDWSEGQWERRPDDLPGEPSFRATWSEGRRVWETASIPEGAYEVRVRASDAPGNPPGEAEELPVGLPLLVTVDRTPPLVEIDDLGNAGRRIRVRDEHSTVQRVELVVGDEVWAGLRPDDGVCDSSSETFALAAVPEEAPALVRAVDAAGNRAEAALRP